MTSYSRISPTTLTMLPGTAGGPAACQHRPVKQQPDHHDDQRPREGAEYHAEYLEHQKKYAQPDQNHPHNHPATAASLLCHDDFLLKPLPGRFVLLSHCYTRAALAKLHGQPAPAETLKLCRDDCL